jgi:hypothetical protein
MPFNLKWDEEYREYTVDVLEFDGGVCYTKEEFDNQMAVYSWESVKSSSDPRHVFDRDGICIRCGVDAEEWGMDCVEGLVKYWEDELKVANRKLRLAEIDNEDLQNEIQRLRNRQAGR